jgi:ATP-binding cassette subfamily B protein
MMSAPGSMTWPLSRLGEAIEALAQASGLGRQADSLLPVPADASCSTPETIGRWIEAAARRLDLDVEPFDVSYEAVESFLRGAGPALFRLGAPDRPTFLALVEASRRRVTVIGPDRQRHQLHPARVAGWLRLSSDAPLAPEVDRLLVDAGISESRRSRARAAILRDRIGSALIGGCWLLRLPAHAPFRHHLRHARLRRHLLAFCVSHTLYTAAWATSWWIVGRAAFEGRFNEGALLAWTFLLFTLVPLGLLTTWSQGVFAIGTAALLKQRLLAGALRLDPDQTRHQGVGQHLARVFESEAIESLALIGGFSALAAAPELVLALVVFAVLGPTVHFMLLAGLVLATGLAAHRYFVRDRRWTQTRLAMTHDLVERMIGHRTRLVQADEAFGNDEEDEALERYLGRSRHMDRAERLLWTIPRIWVLMAVLGVGPSFVAARLSAEALAVTLGATLLAFSGLTKITAGLVHLSGARIAWTQVEPLLQTLAIRESAGSADPDLVADGAARSARNGSLISAHDVTFRFARRVEPTLQGLSFRITRGDRSLLTGPSGSGKSTLVSLLTGLRAPQSGLLLLDGLDRPTLGPDAWRRRVVAAAQFHENHVFTESLAFNLLMGRRWPPRPEDLALAEAICHRLGLGDLLARMPGGLFQPVGETGWQLSHGERSRVFVARALLQGADLVVLDESFAELDPESLRACLREVTELAPTLLVIAHT